LRFETLGEGFELFLRFETKGEASGLFVFRSETLGEGFETFVLRFETKGEAFGLFVLRFETRGEDFLLDRDGDSVFISSFSNSSLVATSDLRISVDSVIAIVSVISSGVCSLQDSLDAV